MMDIHACKAHPGSYTMADAESYHTLHGVYDRYQFAILPDRVCIRNEGRSVSLDIEVTTTKESARQLYKDLTRGGYRTSYAAARKAFKNMEEAWEAYTEASNR